MGKHNEWRKKVKKLRRKRIRSVLAKQKDELKLKEESSPRYLAWKAQQDLVEEALAREEEVAAQRREQQWLEDELKAQQQFKLYQLEKAKRQVELEKQKAILKAEIEAREAKKKEEKAAKEAERLRLENEAKEREQKILDFIQMGHELPPELRISSESNPSQQVCPFFSKVAACRFGDQCSRNHIRPSISDCILFTNMFTHPSLGAIDKTAGDQQDWELEFAEGEIRLAYLDFYEDVATELSSQGNLVRFVVSANAEMHLRGNVYAQFVSERDALKASRALVGRWYAGRRLQPKFVTIPHWKAAICGLQDKRCPKGRHCNFLHIFCNPGGLLSRTPPTAQTSIRKSSHHSSRRERSRSRSLSPWQRTPSVRSNRSPSGWSTPRKSRSSRSPTPDIRRHRSHSRSLSPWNSNETNNTSHRKHKRRRTETPSSNRQSRKRSKSPKERSKRHKTNRKSPNKIDHGGHLISKVSKV